MALIARRDLQSLRNRADTSVSRVAVCAGYLRRFAMRVGREGQGRMNQLFYNNHFIRMCTLKYDIV